MEMIFDARFFANRSRVLLSRINSSLSFIEPFPKSVNLQIR